MIEAIPDVDPYVKSQISARSRSAVTKIGYLNFRSLYPKGLAIAVEGDDDKVVYSHWISRLTPDISFEFFVCGGKRGCKQLSNSLAVDMSKTENNIIFLVDRDFNDLSGFLHTSNVFMTDMYSIENYLVCDIVIEKSIKCAYSGSTNPSSRKKICSSFESDYDEFLNHSYEINRRIFFGRRLYFDIDETIPKSIAAFVSVDLGKVARVEHDASNIIAFPREPSDEERRTLEQEFDELDRRERFRGKYAMKFLRSWLDKLAQEYRNPSLGLFPDASQDRKIKPDELSLGSLASRCSIPSGLQDFLTAHS